MKTYIIVILLGLGWNCCADAPKSKGGNNERLKKEGIKLTNKICQTARDTALIQFFTIEAKVTEIIESFISQDYTTPEKFFIIRNLHTNFAEKLGISSLEIKDVMNDIFLRVIPTRINEDYGLSILAATTVLSSFGEGAFVDKDLKELTICLYIYKGLYHSMAVFKPYENGAVIARASLVYCPELNDKIKTIEDVKQFFHTKIGNSDISVNGPF